MNGVIFLAMAVLIASLAAASLLDKADGTGLFYGKASRAARRAVMAVMAGLSK